MNPTTMVGVIPPVAYYLCLIPIILRLLATPLHRHNVFIESSPIHDALPRSASESSSPGILLLTAHPDDECFFFGPTLTTLLSNEDTQDIDQEKQTTPRVYSLCLSVGDADGLGGLRKTEFERSWDVMGVPEGRRWVLDVE